MIDLATRSITAAVLRPTTKAVEDQGRRYAGRRTIQNIYTLLVDEYGMTGVSYSTLRDSVTRHCMTAFLLVRGADSHCPGPPYGTTPLAEAKARGRWLAAELIRAWNTHGSAPAT